MRAIGTREDLLNAPSPVRTSKAVMTKKWKGTMKTNRPLTKKPLATGAVEEEEEEEEPLRRDYPSASRGGAGAGGAPAQERPMLSTPDLAKLESLMESRLRAYEADIVNHCSEGYSIDGNANSIPHFAKSERRLGPKKKPLQIENMFVRHSIEKLGTPWGDNVPEHYRKNESRIYRVVPGRRGGGAPPPELADLPQGQYVPTRFEGHDHLPRFMCLPCMTFGKNGDYGTIESPDTRRQANAFSPYATVASQKALTQTWGNFSKGHNWSQEHLRCLAQYLDVSTEVSADRRNMVLGLIDEGTKCAKANGTAQKWLLAATQKPGDKSGHCRLYCTVCAKDVSEEALDVEAMTAVIAAHEKTHEKVKQPGQVHGSLASWVTTPAPSEENDAMAAARDTPEAKGAEHDAVEEITHGGGFSLSPLLANRAGASQQQGTRDGAGIDVVDVTMMEGGSGSASNAHHPCPKRNKAEAPSPPRKKEKRQGPEGESVEDDENVMAAKAAKDAALAKQVRVERRGNMMARFFQMPPSTAGASASQMQPGDQDSGTTGKSNGPGETHGTADK